MHFLPEDAQFQPPASSSQAFGGLRRLIPLLPFYVLGHPAVLLARHPGISSPIGIPVGRRPDAAPLSSRSPDYVLAILNNL